MSSKTLAYVSVEPKDGAYRASISIDGLSLIENDPESTLRRAAELYECYMNGMRSLLQEIQAFRVNHELVPARKVWKLGDTIFRLKGELETLSLQLDGFYHHLIRDLGAKRKWLEKVVIFRRYLPREEAVPAWLNWGRCEKGTRRVAERLAKGEEPKVGCSTPSYRRSANCE